MWGFSVHILFAQFRIIIAQAFEPMGAIG